jgi:hypothetical protein
MADQRSRFVAFDLDSGGGAEDIVGANLRRITAGGSAESKGSQLSADSIPAVIASDQAVFSVSTELAAAAALSDAIANPSTAPVGAFLMGYDGTDWERVYSVADGDTVDAGTTGFLLFGSDGANYQALAVDASGNAQLDLLSSAATLDTELPAAAALSDTLANPTAPAVGAHLMGYDRANSDWSRVDAAIDGQASGAASGPVLLADDGSNYQPVLVDAAGHLQLDVLSGGGSDTPTNPVTNYRTTASLPAGSTVQFNTAEAANKRLAAVEVWCSVMYKVVVHTVDNGVLSPALAVGGGRGFESWRYQPPHRDYIVSGSGGGGNAHTVKVTNLDDELTVSCYATFHYED